MKKIRTIIVDDELPARNELSFLLKNIEAVEVVGQAEDGIQALKVIKKEKPDLIFLDIQMPGKTGLELAGEIKECQFSPAIVFITAYDEYALDAFEVNAIDYLLKPYEESRLVEVINRIKGLYLNNQEVDYQLSTLLDKLEDAKKESRINRLAVQTSKERLKLLDYKDIVAIHTKNSKVYAKTSSGEYLLDFNLCELEDKLSSNNFLRVHRSFLVNLDQVREIIPWFKGKYQLVMNEQESLKVPVSRTKVKEIKRIFGL